MDTGRTVRELAWFIHANSRTPGGLGDEEKGALPPRACRLLGMDPRVYPYRPRRPDDGATRARLQELRRKAVGLGTGACTFCFYKKAWR